MLRFLLGAALTALFYRQHYFEKEVSRQMATLAEQQAELQAELDALKVDVATEKTEVAGKIAAQDEKIAKLIKDLEDANQNPSIDLAPQIAAAKDIRTGVSGILTDPPVE